jgi:hypothetical protein
MQTCASMSRWVRHGVRPIAVAAVVTAAIALGVNSGRPAVTLTGIDVGPGISVEPAPGWTVGDQGAGWVTLHNVFASAEMEIKVKPASGSDAAALLQSDIANLSNVSTTGLTNVNNVSAPTTKPLQSANFQQQAGVNYSADGSSRMGAIAVIGWFVELLNPSTHESAFVVYTQNGDAPPSADGEGGQMLDSLL